jgi:hypothetical protein
MRVVKILKIVVNVFQKSGGGLKIGGCRDWATAERQQRSRHVDPPVVVVENIWMKGAITTLVY